MKNYKTTIAGIFTLLPAVFAFITNYRAAASDPVVLSTITAGVGLIVAGDSTKSDPNPPLQ
jgi:hypothetical protein